MAFCKKGMATVRKFISQIDDVLEPIIEEVTEITGKIKDLKNDPTVQEIDDFIPEGTALQGYFDAGLNIIVGAAGVVGTFAEKLSAWLKGKTETERNSNLAKLASVTTAIAHGNEHSELFYDTAIQTHIFGLK